MELDHEFTVPVPVDQAWSVLLDVERVALCMPGATLDSVDGEEYAGRLKVKLGAMTITYKGTARIVAADEASHTVTLEGSGKEARGSGTASATIQAVLHDEGDTTQVSVHTKLNVTGRPAQFGRNILAEVGGKLIARFAKALAEELRAGQLGPVSAIADTPVEGFPVVDEHMVEEPAASVPQQRAASPAESTSRPIAVARGGDDDALDLLEFVGPSVAKRALPIAGVLALLLALIYVARRRRAK